MADRKKEPGRQQSPDERPTTENKPSAKPKVVAELRAEEVRWFYKKTTLEKMWRPLCGRDSLAMETAYRNHQQLLKQQQRSTSSATTKEGRVERIHAYDWGASAVALDELYGLIYVPQKADSDEDREGMQRYRLEPLYWEGNRLVLARGTWFVETSGGNWQPLDGSSPELADQIDSLHLKTFINQPIRSTKPAPLIKVLCVAKDAEEERKPGQGVEVRWYSVDDVLLYSHSHSSKLWRVLRLNPTGTRLMRGYRTEAKMDDGPPPVTDLIFVIHGIGQKRARTKIVKKVAVIRELSDFLLRTQFKDGKHRPVFLPVDWRTDLQLDEHLIEDLTPNFLEQIRGFFNESLMDLMYYASPVHGKKILQGLSTVLNRMYQTFVAHDPGFTARNGRICLVAHSLGTVIAYDILSLTPDGTSVTCSQRDRVSITPQADSGVPCLAFQVHHMFCLGSPLGIFLAGRRVRGPQILRPPGASASFRLHNIYHPADAVAYRIEPLISDVYAKVRPLLIHKSDARNPKPYDSMPNEVLIRQRGQAQTRSSTPKEDTKSETPRSSSTGTSTDPKTKQPPKPDDPKDQVETVEIPASKALQNRIDMTLRPGRVVSAYWAAIRAHECYWTNREVIMYVLTALYGMPKSPGPKERKA